MAKKIAIIAEHSRGEILPVTYELLTLAQNIQGIETLDIRFFILGEDSEIPAQIISRNTGHRVHAIHVPGLLHYNGALYKKILPSLFIEKPFDYICAPHSTSGMDYAPALAVALGGSCITGVEDVVREDGNICFIRSMFGGKISARLAAESTPVVLTLQPGALKAFSPDKNKKPMIEKTVLDITDDTMIFTGTLSSPSEGSDLAKADVVISGGRGIRDAQNYKTIELLAGLFTRSATGGSRPICDYKWITYGKQVGVTGTTVSPKLYIACGISGAPQHVEGMKNAGFIVAINTDPDAPVFQIADVCIVEDLMEFIPLFIETFKQKRRKEDERNDLGESFLA
ncbi:MAG: electron transfer flavoprotein subunit alpha/FixB family protein [Desulfobacula sp.]|jgi:electron transfer flavoprotein alpha subunit